MNLSLFSFLAAVITCSLASPIMEGERGPSLFSRSGTPSSEGTHDGFFYSWWTDGQADAQYTNLDGGSYSVKWSGDGNLYGGKGWSPGVWDRVIKYNGTYSGNGNSYLSIYGQTRNSFVEYYILESYGTYNPGSASVKKGRVVCNGSSYDIYQINRLLQVPVDGSIYLKQFFSIRNPKIPAGEVSGAVDTSCHFDAWKDLGMQIGTKHFWQIVSTEGYYSSGSAKISVSESS